MGGLKIRIDRTDWHEQDFRAKWSDAMDRHEVPSRVRHRKRLYRMWYRCRA
jgi:hypothetical protein